MLCATWNGSTVNGPSVTESPGRISRRSVLCSRRASFSFTLIRPCASGVAYTGTLIWRRMYGSAPVWSSWPCVMKIARRFLLVLEDVASCPG